MKLCWIAVLVAVLAVTVGLGTPALAETLHARLDSFQETPLTLSTTGNGEFRVQISGDETEIQFELSYRDLEGGDPTVAHIHLGRPAITGGVIVFLCGGGGRPPCPVPPATVTGMIVAADIIGPADQGIAAGELDEVIAALRAGATYVNVHNATYPGGEIRGAIGRGKGIVK
jgi:CHRD domain